MGFHRHTSITTGTVQQGDRGGRRLVDSPFVHDAPNESPPGRAKVPASYFFVPAGGEGTRVAVWHCPVLELLWVRRPEASRRIAEVDPVRLPWVTWLPVSRPEASRKWVRLPVIPLVRVVALPTSRPLASR